MWDVPFLTQYVALVYSIAVDKQRGRNTFTYMYEDLNIHMYSCMSLDRCQKVQAKTRHSITDKGIKRGVDMSLSAVPPGKQICLKQYIGDSSFKYVQIGSCELRTG